MTSRAVQYARYGGPEVLEIVEREDPEPGPGQVRLAVRAASVNPIDWKLRSGAFAGTDAPERPVVGGQDVAGVVEALGDGVDGVAVGDEVLGHARGGAYAEKVLADVSRLARKPGSVPWETAASLPVVVTTAYRGLDLLRLGGDAPGTVLVVHGASGGVGMVASQVAVSRGITVIGTASGSHQDDVRALGATPVVYGDGLGDRIRAVTDHVDAGRGAERSRTVDAGRGAERSRTVDAVFDTAGKGDLGELVALVGGPDRVLTIAHPDAQTHGVTFSSGGGGAEVEGALADFVGRLDAGTVRAPEVVVYPLEKAGQAQEDNRTGAVSGKLVLVL